MLFNSLQFAVFFLIVLAVHRALPRTHRASWLLGASLLFYSMWVPVYLALLLVDVGVNYALLVWMSRSRHRARVLALSVCFTIGLLAYCKYASFLIGAVHPLLAAGFGFDPISPDLVLPIGISFYSFQIIALSVDIYRGTIEAPASFARYTLFVCFFPQLIAGPILRGHEFLPQLERGGEPCAERTRRGLWLIAAGAVKKVILADFALAPYVDAAFRYPSVGSSPEHLIAAYSFAFQIYFDFSGYTDIARGLGYLLGYDLPLNFREPYLSRDPAEFWRRWHLTLSQWLRDYLYMSLGGNRRGAVRTQVNLLLTMLLGGLWHGAGWTFVAWGALHGALLIGHRLLGRPKHPERPLTWSDGPRIALLFHGVCLLWIFFRAADLKQALIFLSALFHAGGAGEWPVLQTAVILVCMALHGLERGMRLRARPLQRAVAKARCGPILEGVALGVVLGLSLAVAGTGGQFIYFRF